MEAAVAAAARLCATYFAPNAHGILPGSLAAYFSAQGTQPQVSTATACTRGHDVSLQFASTLAVLLNLILHGNKGSR